MRGRTSTNAELRPEMGVLWYKIWFDLWHNKTRTLLAVLSVAAGVFAVGAIFGMSDQLSTNMDRSHLAVLPSHIQIFLSMPVDADVLLNLRDVPGVEDVEPYNSVSALYKLQPDGRWRQAVIQMRGDYDAQTYELVQLREGHWPDGKNEIAVERMAAQYLNLGIGDEVTFKMGDQERTLPITGLIRHPFVPPLQFQDLAFYFMNAEGMERLDVPDGTFNSLFVRVTPYSADYSREVATAIKDKLAKQDIGVAAFLYQDPARHWGRSFMDGFILVQKLLAVICLVMGAVLVYNTLSNLITQQTDQIGILKAVGGKTRTIIGLYLASAFAYGLLALAIAFPLAAMVAFGIARTFLNWFNIDYNQFQISSQAVVFQLFASLAAPLLAGLPPVLQGANLTVRKAIASYGLGGDFRTGRLDRLVERIGQRWLPPQYANALGNMFRHKGRLLLTELVLVAAGGAFMLVMSLNSSISFTLDNIFARRNYDTLIQFSQNQRAGRVAAMAGSVEGVQTTELRLVQAASMFVSGQLIKEAGIGTNIEGIPGGSDFFEPLIVAGRWFEAGEGRVVVLTRNLAKDNQIEVGDTVTLDLGELGEDQWLVIGIYEPVFAGGFNSDTIYTPLEALYKTTKKYNQGSMLYVRTSSHTLETQSAVTQGLKDLFENHGLKVVQSESQAELRQTNEFQFSIVISMMLSLSIIVAIVGGIALLGALSIGVIERTREIGVLRAVGARSQTILGIFVMEGLLQGWLSWLLALPISFIASPLVARALGQAMFGATLDYRFNWPAVAMWLGIVTVISLLASLLPARRATRISVRDSLAYA